jgi:hypothetical protein
VLEDHMLVNGDISNACGTSCMYIPYVGHCYFLAMVNVVGEGGYVGNM